MTKPTPRVNKAIFMARAAFKTHVAAAAMFEETECATFAIEVAVKTPLRLVKR